MLRLLNLVGEVPCGKTLKAKLQQASVTMGPPGSGKTTLIVDNAKEGDIIIAMTSGSVQNIQHKLLDKWKNNPLRPIVMSIERANALRIYTKQNLFIDECTTVDYINVAQLCQHA